MASQITVRLSDETLAFIDAHTDNRTAYVQRALERERRRLLAEADRVILANSPDYHTEAAEITAGMHQAFPEDLD